jgi:NADP-dependent aldehyde dehydrogenase
MTIQGLNPRTGERTGWTGSATGDDAFEMVLEAAHQALPEIASVPRGVRAGWLRAMALTLEARSASLVAVAELETGLGQPRLSGELVRTSFQLRAFADAVEEGSYLEAIIDHAGPTEMGPRPDLRRMLVPLGPVAVFAASNFPFAFSVAGGDTASAIAAGCPVVVKAHPAHPQLSVEVAGVLLEALETAGAPQGLLALVHGVSVGRALVQDSRIRAVAFTGSGDGGRALQALVRERPDPIPFYGELSGINPVVLTPAATLDSGAEIARGLADSVTLGGGQFCTKPGLALVPAGESGDRFVRSLAASMIDRDPAVALTSGIAEMFDAGVTALTDIGQVLGQGISSDPIGFRMRPSVVTVDAEHLGGRVLEEVFGPVVVVVRYRDEDHLRELWSRLPGSLTATVHAGPDDEFARRIAPLLQDAAGRIVWNGFPTGVAVAWGMQHGGPHPSTTDPMHTSVGATSVRRFLRPVSWQNAPAEVLPVELRDAGDPLSPVPRRIDGRLVLPGTHLA